MFLRIMRHVLAMFDAPSISSCDERGQVLRRMFAASPSVRTRAVDDHGVIQHGFAAFFRSFQERHET